MHFQNETVNLYKYTLSYLPVCSDIHASVLDDGSVVAPAGLGQVHGLVAGEPFGQELRAHTQRSRARNTLDNIEFHDKGKER